MQFKCEMISCSDTTSKGYRNLWKVGTLLFSNKRFAFGNIIRSSLIENISFKNDSITIDTENTTYVFKEVN